MSLEDSLKRRLASATNPEAIQSSHSKEQRETDMAKVPSGVYRPELDATNAPRMSAPAIIDKVLRERRKKDADRRARYGTKVTSRPPVLRQNYDTPGTEQTDKNTRRMLGEKED